MAFSTANYNRLGTNRPNFFHNTPPPTFDLVSITRLAALILSLASMILSAVFGWQLGAGSLLLSITFAVMLIGLALSEFLAASYISLMRQRHDLAGIIVAWLILISGIAISVVAGQSLVNLKMSEIEEQRQLNSDAYKNWQAQQQAAAERVKNLAVSEAQQQQAQSKLAAVDNELNSYVAQTAKNSRGDSAGQSILAITNACTASNWYTRQYCPKVHELKKQLAQQQAILDKYAQYQAAKEYAAELEQQHPSTGHTEATHPGIASLSLLFDTPAPMIRARILLFLSLCVELFAIGLWFLLHRSDTQSVPNFNPVNAHNEAPRHVPTNHTQSVPLTPAPAELSLVNTTGIQSVPRVIHGNMNDVYETLKNGVINGQITNLSFKNLTQILGIHNKDITLLRDQLVADKLAMYDHTRKCLPIPQ